MRTGPATPVDATTTLRAELTELRRKYHRVCARIMHDVAHNPNVTFRHKIPYTETPSYEAQLASIINGNAIIGYKVLSLTWYENLIGDVDVKLLTTVEWDIVCKNFCAWSRLHFISSLVEVSQNFDTNAEENIYVINFKRGLYTKKDKEVITVRLHHDYSIECSSSEATIDYRSLYQTLTEQGVDVFNNLYKYSNYLEDMRERNNDLNRLLALQKEMEATEAEIASL